MKLAEAVAKFIESHVDTVFGVNGGANLHLIHGIADVTRVSFVPGTHECNSGFSADSYARLRGLGVALATSGPGATNLVTAIAASYYDSVPVLYITGNVTSFRMGSKYGVRQYGFQETPIVELVKPITKYAYQIQKPEEILEVLEKAVRIAQEGRKGPVLVDIPDDFQRADIVLHRPNVAEQRQSAALYPTDLQIETVSKWLREAKRPIFIWGAGVRPYADRALNLARSLGVPIATTWGAIDLVAAQDPLMCGGFGTHGTRAANFAVQNADLIISLGSRLDTKATGKPSDFARTGRLVMVDIERTEIDKFKSLGRQVDLAIHSDAGEFIAALEASNNGIDSLFRWTWENQIRAWRKQYDNPKVSWPGVNPYELMQEIGKYTGPDDIVVSDTGLTLGWIMQGFPFKGERFIHAFNQTPMGYGLPAAIGASFATKKRVILLTGDGSIMMSLPELAVIARWQLPIKIILLNNGGHGMCRQTERMWFNGKHQSTTVESGLAFPEFKACAESFGIVSYRVDKLEWSEHALKTLFLQSIADKGPTFLEIPISPDAGLIPQARFGMPIEDGEPALPREEFNAQMIAA